MKSHDWRCNLMPCGNAQKDLTTCLTARELSTTCNPRTTSKSFAAYLDRVLMLSVAKDAHVGISMVSPKGAGSRMSSRVLDMAGGS